MKHILFKPTEKELLKLIEWAEKEILEYQSFLKEAREKLENLKT